MKLIWGNTDQLPVERTTAHHLALDKNDVLPHVPSAISPFDMAPSLRLCRSCRCLGMVCVDVYSADGHHSTAFGSRMGGVVRYAAIPQDLQALCAYRVV